MAKRSSGEPGAALGGLLQKLLADAVVKARAGILPHEMAEKWKATQGFMETMEQDGAPLFREMFAAYDGKDTTPPDLQAFIDQAGGATHLIDWILQFIGAAGGVFSILGELGAINNRPFIQALNNELQNAILSPADLADGTMRGIIDPGTAANEATQSGIDGDRFNWMVELIGEPPGLEECLAVFRRGDLPLDQMLEIIAYSRVNTKYSDLMLMIMSSYMSPADVIELAIKGVVDVDTAKDMFHKAGGYDENFDDLYQGAGDAIGNEAALHLLNQGLASEADVKEVFGRSRMNPIFYDLAMNLRYRYIEPFQIGAMLKANPSLAQQATVWMLNLGYNEEQTTAFIQTYAGESVSGSKQETEGLITQLYQDQVITADQATGALSDLGYDPGTATMILGLSDAKQALSQQQGAITAIRNAYVAGKIDESAASTDLDQLSIPPAARDQWLGSWQIERSTKVKVLTEAQLGTAAKKGVISPEQLINQLEVMGYATSDAQILAANYGVGPLAPAT